MSNDGEAKCRRSQMTRNPQPATDQIQSSINNFTQLNPFLHLFNRGNNPKTRN